MCYWSTEEYILFQLRKAFLILTTYLEGQVSSSPVKKRVQAFQVEIYKFLNDARILSACEAKRQETKLEK